MPEFPDLELRLVRYFVAVAQHGNFGRAATALHVAQPSLSRQIQRLEDQLGARLLDRTPHGSTLTESGEAFLPQAKALLAAAREAAVTARAAAPGRVITIGYVEDLVITPAVRQLRRRFPRAEVRTRHLDWQETDALPEGRVDALVARLPLSFSSARLTVTPLYEEPRVLLVPATHPLAGKESVTMDDLAGEGLVACTSTATLWSSPGPEADDSFEDKLELIADGSSVAVLPAGDKRSSLREDLAIVPAEDAEPVQVVLATRIGDENPLVKAFRELSGELLTAA
ncbi:LysR family transcriptional regulator [Amycolatopsis acidicola]|uniref:LysR family transcriptional regulator n=1 Tax=Amycolatopsis acidicola TaxID=2596893 RepID=A0A5N0UKF2_9PSEU|nr:LysR family transcriptional regulator [Amycolatopsis acidicola]KAA9149248.1 LysR family transcriptional regulator [Amycolatopsis acidicola]